LKWYVGIALFFIAILAFVSYPKNSELEYIYKKSGNFSELIPIYKEELTKNYTQATHKKLLNSMMNASSDEVFAEAHNYFQKNRDDLDSAKRLVDYALSVKNSDEYLKWLDKSYEMSKNPAFLEKKADFFSYTNDKNALENELKRLYAIDGRSDRLKALYSIGARKYAINELLQKQSSLNKDEKRELFYYMNWDERYEDAYKFYKKTLQAIDDNRTSVETALSLGYFTGDYENIVKLYEKLYAITKKTEYLEAVAKSYESLFMMEEAVGSYEKLYAITKNVAYLDSALYIATMLSMDEVADSLRLQKAINHGSQSDVLSLALYLIDEGREEQALDILNKFLGKNTLQESKDVRNALAFYALKSGDKEAAKMLYEEFAPKDLSDRELYYFLLSDKVREKDIPYFIEFVGRTKSPAHLKKALLFAYENYGSDSTRRLFKYATGKRIDADSIVSYIDILPKTMQKEEIARLSRQSFDLSLLNKIGEYFLANESVTEAKNIFKTVLSKDENNLDALESMGKIAVWNNDPSGGLEYFKRYLKLDSTNSEIRYYVAEIYSLQGRSSEAFSGYKYVIEHLKSQNIEQESIYARSYARVYGIDRAKNLYKTLLEKSNNDINIYSDYLEALYNAKKWSELGYEFRDFSHQNAKNIRLLRMYAYCNIEQGRFDIAKKTIQTMESLYRQEGTMDASIYSDLGYLYEKADEPLKALSSYNRALRIEPSNENIIKQKQRIQERVGSFAALEFSSENGNVYKGVRLELADDSRRIGFSYLNNSNRDKYRVYLADTEKKIYLIELGNKHIRGELGDRLKLSYINTPFQPNHTASSENMQKESPSLAYGDSFKSLSYSLRYGLVNYTNSNGLVANGYEFEASLEYKARDDLSFALNGYVNDFFSIDGTKTLYGFNNTKFINATINGIYPVTNLATLFYGAGVSFDGIEAQPMGSIGVYVFDYLTIGYSLARDRLTDEVSQFINMEYKYHF